MNALRSALLVLVAATAGAVSAADRVTVVLSDRSEPYLAAADAFRSFFVHAVGGSPGVEIVTADELTGSTASLLESSAMVIAVGLNATEVVLRSKSGLPMLSTFVPKIAFDALPCSENRRSGEQRCSAIYLDQPVERELNLVEIALPGKRQIGVVVGPVSEPLLPQLRDEAQVRKLRLNYQIIRDGSQLYAALDAVLASCDVLLTVPDGVVLTSSSARSVLISAYRYQVPVVAFSENYVRAGATLAVYSTPEQEGRQAAEVAAAALKTEGLKLPPPQFPKYFSVKVNYQVARSLGLAIPDEQTLLVQLAGRQK